MSAELFNVDGPQVDPLLSHLAYLQLKVGLLGHKYDGYVPLFDAELIVDEEEVATAEEMAIWTGHLAVVEQIVADREAYAAYEYENHGPLLGTSRYPVTIGVFGKNPNLAPAEGGQILTFPGSSSLYPDGVFIADGDVVVLNWPPEADGQPFSVIGADSSVPIPFNLDPPLQQRYTQRSI